MSENPDSRAGPDEQSIALTADYRLLQKRRGHRYSIDDMLVGQKDAGPACVEQPALVLRRADGRRTAEHKAIRAWTGVG